MIKRTFLFFSRLLERHVGLLLVAPTSIPAVRNDINVICISDFAGILYGAIVTLHE